MRSGHHSSMVSLFRPWLRLSLLGVLLSGLLACHGFSVSPSLEKQEQAIIGGKEEIRHPEIGALTANKRTFCTATLIARKVVLTAAHCVDAALRYVASRQTLEFRIDLPSTKDPKGFVSKYYPFDTNLFSRHPKWNQNLSNGFDVGLGILKTKVTDVRPFPINLSPLPPTLVGKKVMFLGYGLIKSNPNAVSPNRKMGAEIPMVRLDKDRFTVYQKDVSVCHGDSGGPSLIMLNGRLVTIGVNSYVSAARVPGTTRSTCAGSGTAMRIDAFNNYIKTWLNKHGDGPETCKVNTDCGLCGSCGSKKVCEPVPFAKNDTICGPCKSDSDCKGGICHRFKTGYRCVHPCDKNKCCPSGTYCFSAQTNRNYSSICIPFENQCPDLKCSKDSDCGPGEFCENEFCLPSPVKKSDTLCKPCKEDKDCKGGLCVLGDNGKFCLQTCGAGDFCPPSYTCAELYPGMPRQCVPNTGVCFQTCLYSSHCAAGEVCERGVCTTGKGAAVGESCDYISCQNGLNCVQTILGKRCLKPCGIPKTRPGSACDNNRCNSPARCIQTSTSSSFCFNTCRSRNDCVAQGGGFCQQGICVCSTDSDCTSAYLCNQNSRVAGACAKRSDYSPCGKGETCSLFGGAGYCTKPAVGSRGLGQPCDPIHRCREGFLCMQTSLGGVCFEDCSKSGKCQLGGKCASVSLGKAVCMCSNDSTCPTGRSCLLYSRNFGLCKPPGLINSCVNHKECPETHFCDKGICKVGKRPEPVPEPNPEPTPEPVADGSVEPGPEPRPEPKPEPKPEPVKETKDAGSSDGGGLKELPPKEGCQCSASSSSAPHSLFGLFFLLVFFRRLRSRR